MVQDEGRRDLRTLLLVALVSSTALLPPELSPSGIALAAVLAAGAGVLLLFPAGRPPVVRRDWRLPAAVISAYLLIGVLTSSQPHRSLSFLLGAGVCLVAFAAAFRVSESPRAREAILGTVVGIGSLAAAWGIAQRAFSLADTARHLRSLGQPELDSYILRAESGRAFGPFLLPSSLGIYLAMALPLTLRCGIRSRWRGWRGILWAGLLLLQTAGMGASLSYGAVASLAIASLLLLFRTPARIRRRILASSAGLAAAGGGAFLLLRGGEGISPLVLRAGNWAAAWRIFLSEPLLGVGFGSFADAYPKQMVAGMNETAFAHNSYLQIAAEGGVPALAWVVLGMILLLSRIIPRPGSRESGAAEILAALPVVAFLVHNLFDFSAYLASLSVTFAALAGVAVASGNVPASRDKEGSRMDALPRWALLLLLLGGAAWGVREAQTRIDIENGRAMVDSGKVEEGIVLLRRADSRDPSHPDPPALLAEIYFPRTAGKPTGMSAGESYARRAVDLRPGRAYGHYLLALYRLSAGDRGEAWTEISRARELFPARELYAREEERLRELLASGPGPGKEPDARR
jgi:O-antigen ligase